MCSHKPSSPELKLAVLAVQQNPMPSHTALLRDTSPELALGWDVNRWIG